jgi:hypothetical protein
LNAGGKHRPPSLPAGTGSLTVGGSDENSETEDMLILEVMKKIKVTPEKPTVQRPLTGSIIKVTPGPITITFD